ncbi:AraC family transcriptional regulator, regulatory protein of adaptative response / methylphosphotriester-DNA alkyltransferase methyltransferase [Anaerovirgula multivorans]|uniref:AraC family transcriptional regulator, regulatory protein of adaptative response / methylphosphotriester-DNA alkyltransferase methyltransferase n=1 Tax=Anaerovirgula multivorans TaxID=312168 RepID=A0A239JEA1_9FIRM|nr:AraC family transcriptional regulator, regulatory protein of adaptative response / methylphosphotriester-DNA alkyltransferase methyltransferase [Anaerovirgula multivorans]
MFFYGVKTTGIFCRSSCKSKTPVRDNVTFFDKAAEAIELGFRPCKRCRPDQLVFEPDLELIKKAKDIFDTDYNKQIDLSQISKQLGLSINHLIRLFKQHSGLTPTRYIAKRRVEKAAELLNQTDINILEISYTTGFKSLSNFYKCFKEETGHTPNEYRKSRGG